jgi:hypothetical protein
MAELEILLHHGWALDSMLWQPWSKCAGELGLHAELKFAERGYFSGHPFQPDFSSNARQKVTVVHSLGLHLVSQTQLQAADVLVIVGGFLNFHDGNERQSRLSQITVRKMLQKLERDPLQVIQDFYLNCGFPEAYYKGGGEGGDGETLKQDLILKDLELLNQSTFDAGWLAFPSQILILHGENDAIAPVHHARRLHELCNQSTMRVHPLGNHALPYLQPEWCLNEIRNLCMVPQR